MRIIGVLVCAMQYVYMSHISKTNIVIWEEGNTKSKERRVKGVLFLVEKGFYSSTKRSISVGVSKDQSSACLNFSDACTSKYANMGSRFNNA